MSESSIADWHTDPIPDAERTEGPLSFAQHRLWVADQLRHGDTAYNLFVAFRLNGLLDVDALNRALGEIVRRHRILRTTFHERDGEPYQRENPFEALALVPTVIEDAGDDPCERRLREAVQREVQRPFDLSQGPLFRSHLFQVAAGDHVLTLTMHHIVTDGWSIGVLTNELTGLYAAFRDGRRSPLPELPVQYAAVAGWARGRLQGPVRDPLTAYWRERLAGAPTLDLPVDRTRSTTQTRDGAIATVGLPAPLVSKVDKLAREERATRFVVLQAALMLLLSRYAGQNDIVVGIPAAGRDRRELEPLIGLFINTLPLRLRLRETMTVRSLIQATRVAMVEALEHQELPFDLIAEASGAERSLDRHPLFQVTFGAEDAFVRAFDVGGLRWEPYEVPAGSTRFDLEVHVLSADGGLRIDAVYSTELFDAATIERLLALYALVVERFTIAPGLPLGEIALTSDVARHQVVDVFNATARAYPQSETIPSLVAMQASQRPDAVAVVGRASTLTYAELERRSNQLACLLRKRGVSINSRVGVCLERSTDLIVALLGILKAGGAYVALDPAYPALRLAHMAEDARLSLVVAERSTAASVPVSISTCLLIDELATELALEDPRPSELKVQAEDLAYVSYTSGSTGEPKGAEVTHRAVLRLVLGSDFVRFAADEVFLQLGPVTFDASTFEIWGALLHGARLVVFPERVPDLEALSRVLAETKVTTLWLTSSLFNTIVDRAPHILEGVRQLLAGGEALSPAHVQRALKALPDTRLFNGYGPTETTVFATVFPIRPDEFPLAATTVPIGAPLANTRVYILDAALNPVPVGVPGELFIGGDGVGRGYVGAPRATAEKFVPDPFGPNPGARLYRTGDRGRWRSDGVIEFLGRRDGQIKIRGHRIELGEIETIIASYPGVDAAVATVQSAPSGSRQLVAYVVASDGSVTASALRTFLKQRLPEYMVPVAILPLDRLPLTANGKIDRSKLPVLDHAAVDAGDEQSSELEQTLRRIWSEVLRQPRVGLHDNFFEIGGDSIISIQIAARARSVGLRLAPRHFFEHQTVAELAAALQAEASSGQAPSESAGEAVGEVLLTPIEHWFFEQALESPEHFNQSVMLEVSAAIPTVRLRAALVELATHHDVLRSRYTNESGVWRHSIDPPDATVSLAEVDLGLTPAEAIEAAIAPYAEALQASFDLEKGPLFKATLFRVASPPSARLLLVAHHLVVDGVSWRILLDDLDGAINAIARGFRLPSKSETFKRRAQRLMELVPTIADAEEDYWRDVTREAPPPLPVDEVDGENVWGRASTVSMELSTHATDALLRHLPVICDARVHEVLIASIARALVRWTGRNVVSLALEGHGRDADANSDLSRTVGWFTAIYPVRLDVPEGDEQTTVRAIVEQLRTVPRGGAGFGVLRYLSPNAAVRRELGSAQPQISVNYLGQFDSASETASTVRLARESSGPQIGSRNRRAHLIDVNARVMDGRLIVDWSYCPDIHHQATIQRLAETASAMLDSVVEQARQVIGRGASSGAHSAGGPDEIEATYPLAPLQLGMFVHSLASRESDTFISQIDLTFNRSLDPVRLADAWRALQAEHPVLRTAFVDAGGGTFRQVVFRVSDLPWRVVDLSTLPDIDREARFAELLREERFARFPLGRAPLMRVAFVRTASESCHVVWTHHHALLDGWSVAILLEQLFRYFDGGVADGASRAMARRKTYEEYVRWTGRQDRAAAERFWRSFLAGATTPTKLVADTGLRPGAARDIEEQELWVDAPLTAAVTALAARQRVTLNTVVQAVWALLLSRHSGQQDIVFGIAVSGRPAEVAGIEDLTGMLLNGVPLRVQVRPDVRRGEWLASVQRQHLALQEHDYCALSDIQRWCALPAQAPLYEATLAFENYPVAATMDDSARRLGVSSMTLVAHTSAALHLRVVPGERLRLMISYDAHRFAPAIACEMLAQLREVLSQCVDNPDATVGELSLRTPVAGVQLPAPGAAGPRHWPGAVHEQFVERAGTDPHAPAILHEGRVTSYAELDAWSNRVAHLLLDAGVLKGEVVGLHAPRSAALVAAMLGVLRAGAAFSIIDPAYPEQRVISQVQNAGMRCILHTDGVPPSLRSWPQLEHCQLLQIDGALSQIGDRPMVCAPAGPDDLAYVAFTSGSTGTPKGILGRHAALAHYALWLGDRFGVGPADRVSVLSALAHDPLLRDVFPPLQLGAALCLPPPEVFSRSGRLNEWMASEKITATNLTPSMARLLTDDSHRGLPTLRLALFVGEPLTVPLVDRLRLLAPSMTVVNLYGTTETQQALAHYVVPPECDRQRPVPVGRGIGHTTLLVVRDDGRLAGIGERGEIWIASELLARGYLNDPELTAARFSDRPVWGGDRAYRTGDLGWYLPSGDVVVAGRDDHQLKVRGFRVEPTEIERMIVAQPGVIEAAVGARPDAGDVSTLVAYVAGGLPFGDLRERLRTLLPDPLVPSRYVRVDRLPRTLTGKLDRRALALLLEDQMETVLLPLETETEQTVAEIWREVLGPIGISREHSFFELGGHSLLAARVVTKLGDRFDIAIEIADLFDNGRLIDLAAFVDGQVRARDELVNQLAEEISALSPEELQAILDAERAADTGRSA